MAATTAQTTTATNTTTTVRAKSFATPVGPLTVLANGFGAGETPAVIAAGFCAAADLWDRVPNAEAMELTDSDDLGPLDGPITDYLTGDLTAIDDLPIAQAGTALQQEVWQGLRDIPAGQTRTYTQLAGTTSKPNAVRAVGSACGRNLVAPFVPCHRALRSDGSLGGYYYGLDVKRWLLDHESDTARLPL
ncbi:MAG: methylated-DNA--[protein]-cysteine S-methyltransferase [Actinomycetota bacterium]